MRFLGKRKPRDIVGADGLTYTHVPAEEVEGYVAMLTDRVLALVDDYPFEDWLDLALKTTWSTVVDRIRGTATPDADIAVERAYAAAGLGYLSRLIEFEGIELDENTELTEHLVQGEAEGHFGDGWFPTVCGMAYGLADFAIKPRDDPEIAALLAPVGAGRDVERRLCVGLLTHLPEDEGITKPELARCWHYGYYLRAVEMSLPDTAEDELQHV